MPTEIQEGSPGSFFRPKSARDKSAKLKTFKSPVYLKDGSRLSGVADNPEQNPFYGFDKNGQEFSQRREYVNPQDITKSRDSDRTANQIRNELESGQKLFMPMSKEETIFAEVMSDSKFKSDSKRRAEMVKRGVPQDRDFLELGQEVRKKLGIAPYESIKDAYKAQSQDKLFMPASEAGAGKGKVAEAAKRLKDLELSTKKDPLDNRDRNHLIQASLLEGIINESQGGAELDIRIGKHESGEGSRYIEYTSEDGDSFKIRATDHDRQLSSITNHRRPDFTLASDKKNVSESSGDWIDAIVKLENETDFRVPARLEDRINSIINRRKEIQGLEQETAKQESLAQEQARKAKEEAEANALETPEGKRLSEEINSIRLELQNSSGTGKYTKNQRKSMFKKVRRLEDELEAMGTFDAGERNINYMPSDPKAPKAQPANRITRQAPAMPGNRFMAPAVSAGAKSAERFR